MPIAETRFLNGRQFLFGSGPLANIFRPIVQDKISNGKFISVSVLFLDFTRFRRVLLAELFFINTYINVH